MQLLLCCSVGVWVVLAWSVECYCQSLHWWVLSTGHNGSGARGLIRLVPGSLEQLWSHPILIGAQAVCVSRWDWHRLTTDCRRRKTDSELTVVCPRCQHSAHALPVESTGLDDSSDCYSRNISSLDPCDDTYAALASHILSRHTLKHTSSKYSTLKLHDAASSVTH